MHILIVKTLTHFYMDMHYCPWHLRKPQIQNINYMNFIEQPNNKGAYSYKVKISKIGIHRYDVCNAHLTMNRCSIVCIIGTTSGIYYRVA